jgi:serine/threonine-protein kinase
MDAWTPATTLGPYVLLEPIGAGGMGEVWKARDTRLDRTVAIKRVKAEHRDRVEHEARAIAALNHPHICQIHDTGPDYLVLEFVEGASPRGPLPAEDVLRLGLQIASALEDAHAAGIFHRDLKPDNILLTRKGSIKLLDFGIAKSTLTEDEAATMESGVVGTPLYMSPEQAEGARLDASSDIFSFGAVLYELCTGRRAFDSLAALLRDEPAPLETPAPLRSVILRCLRKRSTDRYCNAGELRVALEQLAMSSTENRPSIAVLPFVNMSADQEQEYFSDGLADEVINTLSRVPGLKVTARTSAFAFKRKDAAIADIARQLAVQHVLEGGVRKSGQRIRVTAQLVNAADGCPTWSERWDRDLTDIFAVQDDIASAIAAVLQTKLGVSTSFARYTPRVDAYEAYLKGRHFTWSLNLDQFRDARRFYEEAIRLDPQFALAYAALAEYFHIGVSGYLDLQEARALGFEAAERALAIDPALPEANAWRAIYAIVRDYDWQTADRCFRVATAQPTVSPTIRHLHGYFYLRVVGRASEAVIAHRRAIEEDPLNLIVRVGHAVSLRAAGRADEAVNEARRVLELNPRYAAVYNLQALDVTAVPPEEALAHAERGAALGLSTRSNVGVLAGVLWRQGQEARARELIASLDTVAYDTPVALTMFYALCDDPEETARWCERAIDQRHPFVPMVLLTPPYLPVLRASKRWPALARRVNFSESL